MVRNTFGTDRWSGLEWVVWQIVVDDPENRISAPYETAGIGFMLAEETRAPMTELAARLGCVYEGCKDDGTFGSDNDPCYAWWVRVPAAEHARRGPWGWPVVVEELQAYLDREYADQHHWHALVDDRRTAAHATGPAAPSPA